MKSFLVIRDADLAIVGTVSASGEASAWHKVRDRTSPPFTNGRLTCWPIDSTAHLARIARLRVPIPEAPDAR